MSRWIAGGALFVAAVAGCNGPPPKQASGCPEGTMLKGDSCVPSSDKPDSHETGWSGSGSSPETTAQANTSPSSATPGSSVPYDKAEVEALLKRMAKTVKENCGAATDASGKANGPWGTTKISVKLGSRGRSKEATVPAPFDGTPTGACAVQAFANLTYTPFPGSDVVVQWDIEIPQPKH